MGCPMRAPVSASCTRICLVVGADGQSFPVGAHGQAQRPVPRLRDVDDRAAGRQFRDSQLRCPTAGVLKGVHVTDRRDISVVTD